MPRWSIKHVYASEKTMMKHIKFFNRALFTLSLSSRELEGWLSSWEYLLLFQQSEICSQSVCQAAHNHIWIQVQGTLCIFPPWALEFMQTRLHIDIHLHIKGNNINKSLKELDLLQHTCHVIFHTFFTMSPCK